MRGQKLKTFADFLKRATIIPHALLVITEDDSHDCVFAIIDLRAKKIDIPFYEINLSDNPNLKTELTGIFDNDILPSIIYFRGKEIIRKVVGFSKANDFIHSLSEVIEFQI